jgi:HEPN domain-containing protein
MLYESGRRDLADVIGKIVSDYRRELELLEESYIEGRYGEVELLESQSRSCVDVAREILEVLKWIDVELAETSS